MKRWRKTEEGRKGSALLDIGEEKAAGRWTNPCENKPSETCPLPRPGRGCSFPFASLLKRNGFRFRRHGAG